MVHLLGQIPPPERGQRPRLSDIALALAVHRGVVEDEVEASINRINAFIARRRGET